MVTGGAQGAVAYTTAPTSSDVLPSAIWRTANPGRRRSETTVREMLDSLDRDSITDQAKADIRTRLNAG